MIDAHHHIWRQADLLWLSGPEQPRIFGPYGPIRRDYPIGEFLEDLAGTGIEKSVYVQANWPPERFADEAAWVQSIAEEVGWPHAIVGYADFTVDDATAQLDALAANPLMRGVRQQLHWHENPLYRFASRPDLATDPKVRRNVAKLGPRGWAFDLQVFSSQMEDAAALAGACPGVTFVLQHAGMLEDATDEGRRAWRRGMEALAARPNVCSKLSAFGTFVHRVDRDFIREMIETTVAIFGADRCLYGSNFPIEKLWTSYADLFDAFRAGASGLTQSQWDAIFNDTAARIYRV
ncbi:MAG: amidohydrolase family protein [Pseudomonadota bacterium]